MVRRTVLATVLLAALVASASAGWTESVPQATPLWLPSFFRDNMVLQQGKVPCFNGMAEKGATVTLEYQDKKFTATASDQGKFKVCGTAPGSASTTSFTVTVSSSTQGVTPLVYKNVVFGDIYFCGGQSNMQFSMSMAMNGKADIAKANDPNMRLFSVKRIESNTPQWDCPDSNGLGWAPATPNSVGGGDWTYISAVCYYFAQELRTKFPDTPIGVMDSNWGGTMIQPWMSPDAMKVCPDQASFSSSPASFPLLEAATAVGAGAGGDIPTTPGVLWNQMVHPFLLFPIKGALWYQGESNAYDTQYTCRMKAMINDWRAKWNNPELAFLFVEIAPFVYPTDNFAYAWLRRRQADVLGADMPLVAMSPTIDLGDKASQWTSIHPRDKASVGHRLALAAFNIVYGDKTILHSGPVVQSVSPVTVADGKWTATVTFDPATLAAKPQLEQSGTAQCTDCCKEGAFAFQAADNSIIKGATVTMKGPNVMEVSVPAPAAGTPAALMLSFETYPECAVFDKAQALPARPFFEKVAVAAAVEAAVPIMRLRAATVL